MICMQPSNLTTLVRCVDKTNFLVVSQIGEWPADGAIIMDGNSWRFEK